MVTYIVFKYYFSSEFCEVFFKTFTELCELRLIVGGGIGCGIVLNYGGSFQGLIVFLFI